MKFLKLLCIVLMAMLISAAFLACSKSKDIVPETTKKESPVSHPTSAINGLWAGKYYGATKSIPVYLGFNIKSSGKLDVLNTAKDVIGSGDWTFNGTVFKAAYTISSSGTTYSLAADYYNAADKLIGTWGYGSSDTNGGLWDMAKSN
jgi:hypothetical protein